MAQSPPYPVLILSDGTGDTAKKVLNAAVRQFAGLNTEISYARHIRDEAGLREALEQAAKTGSLVISTLVQAEIRELAARLTLERGLRHVDLLGGVLDALTHALDRAPVGVPNLLHRTDAQYFQRVDAIEFTVAADDGRDPARLSRADLVLIGVSRTGKTPLSTFLAHRGLRVANQPLWLDRHVPDVLFDLPTHKVVGLTIEADTLLAIRESRLEAHQLETDGPYVDPVAIAAELEFVEHLCHTNDWLLIDVTRRAVEETASIIVEHLNAHGANVQIDR